MRKNVSKLFVGSLCAFAFGFSAVAEELTESPRWYVSPGVGMIFPEGNQPIDEGLNLSLRLGYDLTEHWSTEGEFSWAPNMTNNDRWRQKAQHIYGLGLDALYHFDRYSRFDPFLSAGWAVYMADRNVFSEGGHSTLTGPRVGIGAMYHLTDNLSLRADGRAHERAGARGAGAAVSCASHRACVAAGGAVRAHRAPRGRDASKRLAGRGRSAFGKRRACASARVRISSSMPFIFISI